MRVARTVCCLSLVLSACSADSRPSAETSTESAGVGSPSRADATASCPTLTTAPVNGRTVTVADGGSLALANGARQPLVRNPSSAVRPIKLLWLVKAPPGTALSLAARSADGTVVPWLVEADGPLSDVLDAVTAVQTANDASPDWSDVPSLLAVSRAGCYEIRTNVDGAKQSLRILVG